MPERESDEQVTPHPDGKIESIINDPGGKQVGVTVSTYRTDFEQERNPMHLSGITNDKMKEFEKLMRGDSPNE